ncbi:MAG: pilus assembly protein PilM [Lachnospiraceae bacterium]|nr:pilus assembly protein PilM [Lachnospiraceae bacterium]
MAGRVISIEIGYSLTRVCEVDYKSKSNKVYNSFTVPTLDGVLNDGVLQLQPHYVEGLRKALQENKVKAKQVIFSVSSAKIASREVVIPFVKEKLIADVVKANASDYFPVDLSQYQLAYSILETIGETKGSQQYKLLVLAAPAAMLKGYYELAAALRLEVAGIDYVGNSLFQVVKGECAKGTHLIVKIEERSTLVMVIQDQKIAFTRNVSYGVEEAIQTVQDSLIWGQLRNVRQVIDVIKSNPCIALPQTADDVVIENITDEEPDALGKLQNEVAAALNPLVGGIARVIDFYLSRNSEASIDRVMITGMGADFQGMDALLAAEINHEVTVINHIEGSNIEKYFKEGFFGEYLTCIGAAIAPVGFKPEGEQSKGKSGTQSAKKGSVNGGTIAFVVLGVGILASIVLIGFSLISYIGMAKVNAELHRQVNELSPIVEVYNNYTSQLNTYSQVKAMYRATESRNDSLYEFFVELEQKLPADVNVVSFTCDKTTLAINMKVSSKSEAAATVEQLRTFKSLIPATVTVTALTVEEDAESGISAVNFTVGAAYSPLELDDAEEEEE